MLQNKTKTALLFAVAFNVHAEKILEVEPPPLNIPPPFQVPTFSGEELDFHAIKPAPNSAKTVDADLITRTVNACYPVPAMNLEIKLTAGTNYRPASGAATIQTADSANYYAGVVASLPLYSGVEIDREQKLAIDRKEKTAGLVAQMLTSLSTKHRTERMLNLYAALEKRSQKRVADGIVAVDEQIGYMEKVATTRGELDSANAQIEGARLALIHQCTDNDVDRLNNFILSEIF